MLCDSLIKSRFLLCKHREKLYEYHCNEIMWYPWTRIHKTMLKCCSIRLVRKAYLDRDLPSGASDIRWLCHGLGYRKTSCKASGHQLAPHKRRLTHAKSIRWQAIDNMISIIMFDKSTHDFACWQEHCPQYLWDVITCPCPWHLLLAKHSSYVCVCWGVGGGGISL